MSIIFNEDCNHFFYTRANANVDVAKKEIDDFILQYKGTNITDFMINLNASIAWFPCSYMDNAVDKYKSMTPGQREQTDQDTGYARYVKDIYEDKGLHMAKMWIEKLRKIDVNPWISVRTNDIHCNDDDGSFLHSSFFLENKNFRRGSHHALNDYYDHGFDFCVPKVRERLLTYVKGILDEFDIFGLELDWMREIYSLRIGKENEGAKYINGFMEDVKKEALKAEEKWGHPVKIGVRLPPNPLTALRLGFDFFGWVEKNLIDLITVTARWATTDNDMPIDLWKKILKNSGVKLAAGLEILLDSMFTEPHKNYLFNSIETARGSAAAYLSMGADAVYLFNYMDSLEDSSKLAEYGERYVLNPKYYREFLSEAGSLEAIGDKPRRHVSTYDDVRAPGLPHSNALPMKCGLNSSGNPAYIGKVKFKTLRIPTGKVPAGAKMQLILGVDKERALPGSAPEVYVNSEKAEFSGYAKLPTPALSDLDYLCFNLNSKNDGEGVALVEVGTTEEQFTIKWAEIGINMNY